jgi:protein SCO1/2
VSVSGKFRLRAGLIAGIGLIGLSGSLASADDATMHHHHDMSGMMMVSTASYTVPDVQLLRENGRSVSLRQEMDDGRPVVLNFIFTTCTSICPLMSQTFSQFASKLGSDRQKVHLMSISIDPEEDTPQRLTEYAKKFHAGPEWQHYTGTLAASVEAQKAFDVYRGEKMSHTAVTLLRAAPGQPWQRIDGFATADDLIKTYRELTAAELTAAK